MVASLATGVGAAIALMPKLETGGTVTKTGMAEVHKGEVFSGTKNEMGFGNNGALASAIDRNTRALTNMQLTAGRGEIRVAMEGQRGGLSLGIV